MTTEHKRHGQTDRQTDRQTTYDNIYLRPTGKRCLCHLFTVLHILGSRCSNKYKHRKWRTNLKWGILSGKISALDCWFNYFSHLVRRRHWTAYISGLLTWLLRLGMMLALACVIGLGNHAIHCFCRLISGNITIVASVKVNRRRRSPET